jgi:hypothetical protein
MCLNFETTSLTAFKHTHRVTQDNSHAVMIEQQLIKKVYDLFEIMKLYELLV